MCSQDFEKSKKRFPHKCLQPRRCQQFRLSYLDQALGSVGQPSVWGARLMIAFYCSRRSRSSKLSFCSPQGAGQQLSERAWLCVFYTRGEVGRARSSWSGFTGGRRSAGTLILLFGSFVLWSGERVNPSERDVSALGVVADQTDIWAFLKLFKEA